MKKPSDESLMRKAIELSKESVGKGGRPFGAIIVKHGEIIAAEHNHVAMHNDPTAHAEIEAIRVAAKKLNTFDLSGCVIYTSCEPCPMCLGAIYWARIDKIYYANDKLDAKKAGFDDSFIYEQLEKPMVERKIQMVQVLKNEAESAFQLWKIVEVVVSLEKHLIFKAC